MIRITCEDRAFNSIGSVEVADPVWDKIKALSSQSEMTDVYLWLCAAIKLHFNLPVSDDVQTTGSWKYEQWSTANLNRYKLTVTRRTLQFYGLGKRNCVPFAFSSNRDLNPFIALTLPFAINRDIPCHENFFDSVFGDSVWVKCQHSMVFIDKIYVRDYDKNKAQICSDIETYLNENKRLKELVQTDDMSTDRVVSRHGGF